MQVLMDSRSHVFDHIFSLASLQFDFRVVIVNVHKESGKFWRCADSLVI